MIDIANLATAERHIDYAKAFEDELSLSIDVNFDGDRSA